MTKKSETFYKSLPWLLAFAGLGFATYAMARAFNRLDKTLDNLEIDYGNDDVLLSMYYNKEKHEEQSMD